MKTLPKILICDDDALFHSTVKLAILEGCEFVSAFNGDEALELLRTRSFSLLLLDLQMRTPTEGLDYLSRFKVLDPDLAIIIMSGIQEFSMVRKALKQGADDYLLKSMEKDEWVHAVKHSIHRSMEKKNLRSLTEKQSAEVQRLQEKHQLIGVSSGIQQLRRQIEKAKESHANVLITGETGTGKEVVARSLRKTLPDGSMEPFLSIDSSTIQSSTAESILFGHERGAFTGADRMKKGVFEEADGGTVYFDEIANMSLEIQCKLLRVLEEKEVKRLGSQRVIPLEFRVICATNQDLEGLVREGKFKDDLLQRLNVIPLTILPLRERKEDVPALIEFMIRRYNRSGRDLKLGREIVELFNQYNWPGNVRELSNLIRYLLDMSDADEIGISDLPPKFIANTSANACIPGTGLDPADPIDSGFEEVESVGSKKVPDPNSSYFQDEVSKFEKKILQEAMLHSAGKVTRASEFLGLDRSYLYVKLKEHGLFSGKSRMKSTRV